MTIIGIDLGTTNSLVACWTDNGSVLIPNILGSPLTPSVVSVDENGEILVGQVAKERLISHPHMTAAVFKRYMGTSKTFRLGSYTFLPEELSSFVIRSLKQDAEAYLGHPVTEAVISVPAYFNDAQRKATQRAGELAGLRVERLLNEPTAAAIAYGLHQQEPDTKFLVFDLGGGTFDVSILELFDQVMEVKSVAGDNYLGGEDFTDLLISEFLQHHQLEADSLDAKAATSLRKQAEHCKHILGRFKQAPMSFTWDGQEYHWQVDRQQFEEMARPLLNKLRAPVERAMQDATISPDQLDAIVLIGGGTRMSLIYSFIGKLFGRLPAAHIHPEETVALGVGIQAALKERNAALSEVVLTDVSPYTLGTMIAIMTESGDYEPGYFYPIIERNTVIPVSREERLYTLHDQQTEIKVEIYQGESRHTKNNMKLGQLDISVPPGLAGEQAVDIRYTYDINGILEVEVTVVTTGAKKRMIIEENPGALTTEEIARRFRELEAIKIHPRDRTENRLLLARGDRLYEESLADKRQVIAALLQRFEDVLKRQNEREIRKEAEKLKEILDELERV
ncbi:molecular chaperone HscC [Paenibacillus sp. J2TS4]|uniref:molecular chaperone HscC n=1 Tax=Paenibacillus sp. J2TS4 TaxID=2807194 RepID=UPI001B29A47D|nr:molecular chaperone HscC [Paenibacillus sp. J2TS4]GIP33197.1 molecular chaperone HscC [Paenibacillus sp. J2TS4]